MPAREQHPEGHRRVDVAPGDRADGVGQRQQRPGRRRRRRRTGRWSSMPATAEPTATKTSSAVPRNSAATERASVGDMRTSGRAAAAPRADLRTAVRAATSVPRRTEGPADPARAALSRRRPARRRRARRRRGRAGWCAGSRRGTGPGRVRAVAAGPGHAGQLQRPAGAAGRWAGRAPGRSRCGRGWPAPSADAQGLGLLGVQQRRPSPSAASASTCRACRSSGRAGGVLQLEQLHRPLDVGQAAAAELGVGGRVGAAGQPLALHPGLDPADLGDLLGGQPVGRVADRVDQRHELARRAPRRRRPARPAAAPAPPRPTTQRS